MKMTELKAEDLIFYKGKVAQVGGADPPFFYLKAEDGYITVRFYDNSLEPIPLTGEMLEKNGWKYNKTFRDWALFIEDEEALVVYNDGKGYRVRRFYQVIHRIQYVHQLQHILWALGIDDNLKI